MTEMTNPTPSDPGGATAPTGGTQDGNSMLDGGALEDDGGLGAPDEASRVSSTPPHGDPLGESLMDPDTGVATEGDALAPQDTTDPTTRSGGRGEGAL